MSHKKRGDQPDLALRPWFTTPVPKHLFLYIFLYKASRYVFTFFSLFKIWKKKFFFIKMESYYAYYYFLSCMSLGYSCCQVAVLKVCKQSHSTRSVWHLASSILTSTGWSIFKSLQIQRWEMIPHFALICIFNWLLGILMSFHTITGIHVSFSVNYLYMSLSIFLSSYFLFFKEFVGSLYILGRLTFVCHLIQWVPPPLSVLLLILFMMISFGFQKWLIFM